MAVENLDSDLYAAQTGGKWAPVRGVWQPVLHVPFKHTQSPAGDANSTINLVRLPAGRIRILQDGTRLYHSAYGSSRVLDVGWLAYTAFDGADVAADPDGLASKLNVSGAGNKTLDEFSGMPWIELDSADGIVIRARVTGGSIPNNATLNGAFAVVLMTE